MIVKGQKVNDRYTVSKTIGEGGMANVYLAHDEILDRDVAIKVLRGDLANDEKFVRRFQREALSASSLSHPNIVEIYDVGEDDGDYYIVMEYIPGKNLKQLLKKRGKLTVAEVIDIMLQITSAMSVAHDSLIIHRDLKPQNILIMDDGGVKITDFGIAMALNSTQLTQTNSAMGSVHYFPPEQASGKGATLKSDIYSLGIMMYELLTGVLPFRGDNAVEIALKHLKEPISSVREDDPSIPQSVENVIITATAKNPKNRYNNANEMHEDLLTVLNKERLNEPKRKLKYSEGITDDVAVIDKTADIDGSIVKEIKDDTDEKNKKLFIILGSIFGVLIVGLFAFFIIIPMLTEVPDVKIPTVQDMTQEEAESKLEKEGLEVEIEVITQASDIIKEGNVIGTSPAIGRTVKKGTKVKLIISSGGEKILIEDLTGKDAKEEKGRLEALGLKVTIEEKDIENPDPEKVYKTDEVVDQSVKSGTELSVNDKITLYVPKIYEKYPDIVNEKWTLEEVEAWALKKEIKIEKVYIETSESEPGTILKQSRGTDSVITKGATLILTIAKAKEDITQTPNQDSQTNPQGQN